MAEPLDRRVVYTRQTLMDHGMPAERVHMAPYGETFSVSRGAGPVRRGSQIEAAVRRIISQRKGIEYLLEALELLRTRRVELMVCGWAVDDLALFRG